MSGVFGRLAPYIQDFIYANHWEDLREIQKEACQVVWDTDDNLLLSSGHRLGKDGGGVSPGADRAVPPPLPVGRGVVH